MGTIIAVVICTSDEVKGLVAGGFSPGRGSVRRGSDISAGTAGDSVARSRLHSAA
ncbi:MAG: hypothetical protein P4L20_09515 [Acidimicrobiales bacterium]|nr:hypothetical protein [Acidimicrobiales bacterium]